MAVQSQYTTESPVTNFMYTFNKKVWNSYEAAGVIYVC
jgi:hypothetical protein